MTRLQRLMKLHRLMDAAGDGGSDAGGTGAGEGGQGEGQGEGEGEGEADKGKGDGGGEGGGEQGQKKPSDTEAALLKDVMTKKKALETTKAALEQANARLKDFDGLDVAKVRKLLADAEAAEEAAAVAKGDYEKLKTKMAESHATEKNTLLAQIEAANGQATALQKQIAELTVGGAFTGSAFIPELTLPVNKARALYGAHFEFKDGAVVGFDKPAGAADRAPLVDAAGTPLSFDAALKQIIDSDPDSEHLYRSKLKPGAGSSTQKAPRREKADRDDTVTGIDRIAQGLKNIAKQSGGK